MHDGTNLQASASKLLKKDVFGRTDLVGTGADAVVRRSTADAARGVRWLARLLMRREARALALLEDVDGIPQLVRLAPHSLDREFIAGVPMQLGQPRDPQYFKSAAKLVRRMHRCGVAHNDLAKEPNLLVTDAGKPAVVDFQLASSAIRRGRLFRLLAREDIRHLLKHKRTYCPEQLTARERQILDSPSWLARLWMKSGKRVYLFVTRRIMGWEDREGAGDRV
jgi:predicted Ser/Thr protein kinase